MDEMDLEIYNQGFDAGYAGSFFFTNPYTIGSPHSNDWSAGWVDGAGQRQQEDAEEAELHDWVDEVPDAPFPNAGIVGAPGGPGPQGIPDNWQFQLLKPVEEDYPIE